MMGHIDSNPTLLEIKREREEKITPSSMQDGRIAP